MRHALNQLSEVNAPWVRQLVPLEWYERYSKRIEDSRLPREQSKRDAYAQTVGEDGFALLDALEDDDDVQTVWGNYDVPDEELEKLA